MMVARYLAAGGTRYSKKNQARSLRGGPDWCDGDEQLLVLTAVRTLLVFDLFAVTCSFYSARHQHRFLTRIRTSEASGGIPDHVI
jgi:hypothetical protein